MLQLNKKAGKLKTFFSRKKSLSGIVISIVILVEIIAILMVASFAWVETVSSIKLTTKDTDPVTVDTYVFTEAMIGGTEGTIDLGKYFKPSGDMHFAPASSADGVNLYFPKLTSAGTAYVSSGNLDHIIPYRKGNTSDMNTNYLSVSFKVKADTNADFFFTQVPTFSNQGSNIRVSVTAYSEGTSAGDLFDENGAPVYTKIYGTNASTAAVVKNAAGATASTTVEAFSAHIKGTGTTNRLFAVGANETKIVTINMWLQGSAMNNSLPQNISISNFGITSSLTPRHVTLLPTPTWDVSGITQYFYAWCWGATNGDSSRLYKLELDAEEHYSFDYNGTYQNTLFFRSGNGSLTTETMNANNNAAWTNGTIWNKTEDTSIPNDPVDPTFIIETINGSTQTDTSSGNNSTAKKSTGSWHDPATIKIAYVDDQDDTWGKLSATSYIGTATTSHVLEQTNSTSTKHADTVHAWPGKILQLKAELNLVNNESDPNHAFEGWYDNAEGTGTPLSTNATFTPNAPSTPTTVTYYAKFKETRTFKLEKYLDGASSATACGTLTINYSTSSTAARSWDSGKVDKGATVTYSAAAQTGYTLDGIYTLANGGTKVYTAGAAASSITLNDNTTYYARFTTNTHDVTATAIGTTGSTVRVDDVTGNVNGTAGTTCTMTDIKFGRTVKLTAIPAAGYEFVGWYTDNAGTTAATGSYTNAEYTFTLGDADAEYYAKFKQCSIYLTGWINGAAVTSGQSALQFSPTGNANEYSLTYTFTGNQGGYQYVTIYDGADVYHPGTHESGSGVAADLSKTDQSPNADPKWRVNATSHDVVTFTWNNSTKTLSWTITKYYYFDVSSCSWFKNDGCVPAVSYNYGSYQAATLVSGNIYRIEIPENVSTFSLARHNSNGNYNAFNITKNGTNNRYNINSNCNGGSWTTY